MEPTNWVRVEVEALTAIRATWPVQKLEWMALEGNHTAVSGDALAPYQRRS